MNKFVITAAALGLAAAAMPAAANAQSARHVINQQAQIDRQINQGIRQGRIDRVEQRQLTQQSQAIRNLRVRYERSRPGLTRQEIRDLDQRLNNLQRNVQIALRSPARGRR